MIDTRAAIVSEDDSFVTVFFYFEEMTGAGIESVTIYKDDDSTLHAERLDGCPLNHEVTVVAPKDGLPLWVEGVDCNQIPTSREDNGPFLDDPIDLPDVPGGGSRCDLMCPNDPECDAATIDVSRIYLELQEICEECKDLEDRRTGKEAEIAFYIIMSFIIAAAIAAILLSNALGVFAFWLVIALGGLLLTLLALLGDAIRALESIGRLETECKNRLRDLQTDYSDAVDTLNSSSCCAGCYDEPLPAPC